jgi:hypothetical protein
MDNFNKKKAIVKKVTKLPNEILDVIVTNGLTFYEAYPLLNKRIYGKIVKKHIDSLLIDKTISFEIIIRGYNFLITEIHIYDDLRKESYFKIANYDAKIIATKDEKSKINKLWNYMKKENKLVKATLPEEILIDDSKYLQKVNKITVSEAVNVATLDYIRMLYENHKVTDNGKVTLTL